MEAPMAGRMAALKRVTAAERKREEREEAQRNARVSMRVGTLGVAVLFLSGIGVWLLPDYVYAFIGGMVVGILLILAAFFLVRGSVLTFKGEDETKLY